MEATRHAGVAVTSQRGGFTGYRLCRRPLDSDERINRSSEDFEGFRGRVPGRRISAGAHRSAGGVHSLLET